MNKFLVTFGLFITIVSGLVGLGLAAHQFGVDWAFWLMLAIGIPISLREKILNAGIAIRNYDKVLKQLTEARQRILEHESELTGQLEKGVDEGRKEVLGAIAASGFEGTLLPYEAATPGDGRVFIAARMTNTENPPVMGARFDLRVATTGQSKGFAEVVDVTEQDGQVVLLNCINPPHKEFWRQLLDSGDGPPIKLNGMSLIAHALHELPSANQSGADRKEGT